jgi:hypothetical protein
MKQVTRGLTIAIVQVAIIGGIGAKLLYERATQPRAWVETAGVDPDLPIRGRYVALGLLLPGATAYTGTEERVCGRIEVREGHPVAVIDRRCRTGVLDWRSAVLFTRQQTPQGLRWRLVQPVAYFLPEHARDPSLGAKPGELWVEATFPPHAAPRPIQLGLLRGGRIEPLS